MPLTASVLLNVVAPVTPSVVPTVVALLIATAPLSVDAPLTSSVLLNVVAPVTPSVVPTVAAPLIVTSPVSVDAPLTASVLLNVVAPLTRAVPVTSNVFPGFVIPMPTFPDEATVALLTGHHHGTTGATGRRAPAATRQRQHTAGDVHGAAGILLLGELGGCRMIE